MQDFTQGFLNQDSSVSQGVILLFVCICLWVLSNMGELRRIWDLGMAFLAVRARDGPRIHEGVSTVSRTVLSTFRDPFCRALNTLKQSFKTC